MSKGLKLGDRVRVFRVMKREGAKWRLRTLKEPIDGIVTGQRTRWQGEWYTDYDEFGGHGYTYFRLTNSFVAYDVTFNLHRRPLVVLREDVQPLNTSIKE